MEGWLILRDYRLRCPCRTCCPFPGIHPGVFICSCLRLTHSSPFGIFFELTPGAFLSLALFAAAAPDVVTASGATACAALLCSFSAAAAAGARAARVAFLLAFALAFGVAYSVTVASGVRAALLLVLFSELAPDSFLFLTLFVAAPSGAVAATYGS